jgi:hypothetical protein
MGQLSHREQIDALPPSQVGEVIADALYAQPRPAPRHAVVVTALVSSLYAPFQHGFGGPGGWVFLLEPERLTQVRVRPFEAVELDLSLLWTP